MALVLLASSVVGAPTTLAGDVTYALPVPAGTSIHVTQGNETAAEGGDHTGTSAFAFDFGTPDDVPFVVVASRAGTVIDARGDVLDRCAQTPDEAERAEVPACWTEVNRVLVDHGDGTAALYLHFAPDSVSVLTGDVVDVGTPLGIAGSTGWATAPQLHFQVETTPPLDARTDADWWWTDTTPIGPVSFHDPAVLAAHPDGIPGAGVDDDGPYVSSTPLPATGCPPVILPTPSPAGAAMLGGSWLAPEACVAVAGPVMLSASAVSVLDGTSVSRVIFRVASPVSGDACTAEASDAAGAWSCLADLAALGTPPGPVTLTFDVISDAGDVVQEPDGPRTIQLSAGSPRATWADGTTRQRGHVPFGDLVRLAAHVSHTIDIEEVRFTAWWPDWAHDRDAARIDGFDADESPAVLAVCRPAGGTPGCRWDGDPRAATVSWTWDPTKRQEARVVPEVARASAAIDSGTERCVPVTLAVEVRDPSSATGGTPATAAATRCDREPDGRGRWVFLDPLAPPDAPAKATIRVIDHRCRDVCATEYRITWTPVEGATGYEVWTENAWSRWIPDTACDYKDGLLEPRRLARVGPGTTSIVRSFTPEIVGRGGLFGGARFINGSRYTVRAVNDAGASEPRIARMNGTSRDGVTTWSEVRDCNLPVKP